MAKSKRPNRKSAGANGGGSLPKTTDLKIGPTGRLIVTLKPEASPRDLASALANIAGVKVALSSDFENAVATDDALDGAGALVLEHIHAAIIDPDTDQVRALEAAVDDESNPILAVEPEQYVVAFDEQEYYVEEGQEQEEAFVTAAGRDYLRGYTDAVRTVADQILRPTKDGAVEAETETEIAAVYADTATHTWGLQATRVPQSNCTGRNMRVAVLDTGMDLTHPDFAGRNIIPASFVPGQTAQDGHSHGTHCIGTACGPLNPPGNTRRYGIAYQSSILVGKVLNNSGSGMQGWILTGINWAIQNRATVISMSLGSPVTLGTPFSPAYEQAAQAALNNGCLIVAAAGNSGANPQFNPVGSPANCPSVMAVGAVDQSLQRATFSCIARNPNGGELNIAAPGVAVFSTVPMPTRYGVMSGTSMATPHVAGIAALYAQWTGKRGRDLWNAVVAGALNINQPAAHVGAGLVQACRCLPVIRPPRRFPIRNPLPFPPRFPSPAPIIPRLPKLPGQQS